MEIKPGTEILARVQIQSGAKILKIGACAETNVPYFSLHNVITLRTYLIMIILTTAFLAEVVSLRWRRCLHSKVKAKTQLTRQHAIKIPRPTKQPCYTHKR